MSKELYSSADFDEIILTHLIRSKKVFTKASELKLTGEDFLSSQLAGIQFYKLIAEVVFEIGTAPVSRAVLELHVKPKLAEVQVDTESFNTFLDYVYSSELMEDYICTQLLPFIRFRRISKASSEHKHDPLQAYEEMNKLAVSLNAADKGSLVVSAKPFDSFVLAPDIIAIPTGFNEIDLKIYGLAKQECGLLIGHSGSGKTASASYIAINAARAGKKVLYLSLEEPYQNIVYRWYANQFRISYSQLHFAHTDELGQMGHAAEDVQKAIEALSEEEKERLALLDIIDARALAPVNVDTLRTLIDEKAQQGFVPDVIIIDQMDYLSPVKQLPKGANPWQEYEQIAFECDSLSQHMIGGVAGFALWVVHQAKGEMRWTFGYDDIAGFRGIVKPFDLCLGVGRSSRDEPYVNIFTMKVRHTEHAQCAYRADFQYMDFSPQRGYVPEANKHKKSGDKMFNKNPKKGVDYELSDKKVKPGLQRNAKSSSNGDSGESAYSSMDLV